MKTLWRIAEPIIVLILPIAFVWIIGSAIVQRHVAPIAWIVILGFLTWMILIRFLVTIVEKLRVCSSCGRLTSSWIPGSPKKNCPKCKGTGKYYKRGQGWSDGNMSMSATYSDHQCDCCLQEVKCTRCSSIKSASTV